MPANETLPYQAHQPPESPRPRAVHQLGEQREPLVITRNGETRAVIQDVQSYQQTRETVALGNQQIETGKVRPAKDVIKRIRKNRANT